MQKYREKSFRRCGGIKTKVYWAANAYDGFLNFYYFVCSRTSTSTFLQSIISTRITNQIKSLAKKDRTAKKRVSLALKILIWHLERLDSWFSNFSSVDNRLLIVDQLPTKPVIDFTIFTDHTLFYQLQINRVERNRMYSSIRICTLYISYARHVCISAKYITYATYVYTSNYDQDIWVDISGQKAIHFRISVAPNDRYLCTHSCHLLCTWSTSFFCLHVISLITIHHERQRKYIFLA